MQTCLYLHVPSALRLLAGCSLPFVGDTGAEGGVWGVFAVVFFATWSGVPVVECGFGDTFGAKYALTKLLLRQVSSTIHARIQTAGSEDVANVERSRVVNVFQVDFDEHMRQLPRLLVAIHCIVHHFPKNSIHGEHILHSQVVADSDED